MDRKWKWRVFGAIALTILSILMLVPTVVETFGGQQEDAESSPLPDWYKRIFKQKLILGLDLQGGIHLQYKVDMEEALARRSAQTASNIRILLKKEADIEVEAARREQGDLYDITTIDVQFASKDDMGKLTTAFINEHLPRDSQGRPQYSLGSSSGTTQTLVMSQEAIDDFRDSALERAIETIERRINEFGVAESTITKRGDDELVVQLPGVKESEFGAAKQKLAQTGQLRFQIVDRERQGEFFAKMAARAPSAANWPAELDVALQVHKTVADASVVRTTSREIFDYMASGQLDDEHYLGIQEVFVDPKDPSLTPIDNLSKEQEAVLRKTGGDIAEGGIVRAYQAWYVFANAGISGENVEDASVGYDQFNRPVVQMRFSQADAERFYEMTKTYTKELMAIMIDEIVYSAPRIKEPIPGGRVQIEVGTGGQAFKEASALVAVLKSGALQAPLRKVYDSQVGPSLGSDSIEAGRKAVIFGFLAVVIFMVIYYKGAGLVVDLALGLNVLFVLAGLTAFGATLTLPGIAAIVLTIGMAVDANVLVFERIREELRSGSSVRRAIDLGYSKAMSSIVDANLTTGIAAVVLYQFGSGPVRGFAVSLGIGIICSVYTALVVTRLVFDFVYGRGQEPETMSI